MSLDSFYCRVVLYLFQTSLRSWRDSWAGERRRSRHIPPKQKLSRAKSRQLRRLFQKQSRSSISPLKMYSTTIKEGNIEAPESLSLTPTTAKYLCLCNLNRFHLNKKQEILREFREIFRQFSVII